MQKEKKVCKTCGEHKPLYSFGVKNYNTGQLQDSCKQCFFASTAGKKYLSDKKGLDKLDIIEREEKWNKKVKRYARKNKKESTLYEKAVQKLLVDNSISFISQKVIRDGVHSYITDFFIPTLRNSNGIIIEVDGGYHTNEEQEIKDANRDKILRKRGLVVIRIENKNIETKSDVLLETINKYHPKRISDLELKIPRKTIWIN